MAHPHILPFIEYLQRNLDKLSTELNAYPNEADIWLSTDLVPNSAGTLSLHLIGNLHHFIGFALGDTGYVRDRPAEFATRDMSRIDLINKIKETREMVATVLHKIEDPDAPYPEGHFGAKTGSVHYFLLQWLSHFTYHLGQVNYHRRLLATTNNTQSV